MPHLSCGQIVCTVPKKNVRYTYMHEKDKKLNVQFKN